MDITFPRVPCYRESGMVHAQQLAKRARQSFRLTLWISRANIKTVNTIVSVWWHILIIKADVNHDVTKTRLDENGAAVEAPGRKGKR